jgi:hypothetical protein
LLVSWPPPFGAVVDWAKALDIEPMSAKATKADTQKLHRTKMIPVFGQMRLQ